MGIKRMSAEKFRRCGLLQEINRLFLHPRGLALEVIVEDDNIYRFGEVWDYRDDLEGIVFDGGMLANEDAYAKARFVKQLYLDHLMHRVQLFGTPDGVQPLESEPR